MLYFSFLSDSGCLTSDNKHCIFPWTYSVDGSNHQGCANPDNHPGGLWCPTEVADNGTYISGSGNWGYCSDNCYNEPGKNYRFITKNSNRIPAMTTGDLEDGNFFYFHYYFYDVFKNFEVKSVGTILNETYSSI